ncbi:Mediator of RNA polymerase II transcription subunit 34 [Vitis vinifera]|uniref:Mediator of RNA polymerase II transcription subunit 34 n=1 Tax=Vitis vinifera TaxID=29760 RepID=A0A438IZB2_VITVI|nr:Mediator of RNA polymerase II transcription subunit 34 [Vitis vinifera]
MCVWGLCTGDTDEAVPFGGDCLDQIKNLLDRQEKLHERQSELKTLLEACKGSGSPVKDGASVAVENWSGPFDWDAQADDVRFNIFGISTYRANQREVSAFAISLSAVTVI